jgi:hypothetical protein
VRLDAEIAPQPDGLLIIPPEHGGRVRMARPDRIVAGGRSAVLAVVQ